MYESITFLNPAKLFIFISAQYSITAKIKAWSCFSMYSSNLLNVVFLRTHMFSSNSFIKLSKLLLLNLVVVVKSVLFKLILFKSVLLYTSTFPLYLLAIPSLLVGMAFGFLAIPSFLGLWLFSSLDFLFCLE